MPLSYTVTFSPGRYYVAPVPVPTAPEGAPPLFGVIDEATRFPICMTPDENAAKAICLALGVTTAYIHGDNRSLKEFLKAFEPIINQ